MLLDARSTLATTVLIFLAAVPCHADVIAADNFPAAQQSTNGWAEVAVILPDFNYVFDNVRRGQSFIATSSGLLTTLDTLIAAGMDHPILPSPPLDISIYESDDGIPSKKLGTVSYDAADFVTVFGSDDHRVTVDFAGLEIPIHAGQEYLVAYESPFGVVGTYSSDAPYFVGLVLNNPMAFGRGLSAAYNGIDWQMTFPTPPSTFELATRVWVTPEPTSAHLLVLAAAAVALSPNRRCPDRRRHDRRCQQGIDNRLRR